MDRIRSLFVPAKAKPDEYEPLADDESSPREESTYEEEAPFSWVEYSIFALVGVAMLWAWNMFLAAAPYFQTRFQSSPRALAISQSAISTVSTNVNLLAMLILTNFPHENCPFRISAGLLINAAVFGLLTVSTALFLDTSAGAYLVFVLLMVAAASWATGMIQHGAFTFAASFNRPEYTQAIMAGQGVAGILPPLTQMLSFLAFSSPERQQQQQAGQPSEDAASWSTQGESPHRQQPPHGTSTAAFIYFLTAVLVSCITLAAFAPLARRYNRLLERRAQRQQQESVVTSVEDDDAAAAAPVPTPIRTRTPRFVSIPDLLRKRRLRWAAAAVFVCFVVAMFFPVFTGKILSVHDDDGARGSRGGGRGVFAPGAFIPLGFFFWNLGDLLGRVAGALPCFLSLRRRPRALFAVGVARVVFLPMYLLCNLHGRGAVVESDLFYLLVVQFPFGLTNGWLGSSAMMAAGEFVGDGEREAAGGFMGLCLVLGLTVGSWLSFTVAGI
ncbi:hypothetical protein VTK56DRAFT_8255 [Thermocarpiscus australiensis]